MHRLPSRLFAAAVAATMATLPVAAHAADNVTVVGQDVVPMLIWMFVGVGVSALVLGTLYLFKRRVGGFPKNPTWVAPITVMRASDLPGDPDPHEATSDGGHAPVH
jgi:hypothetical protein